jgi:DNA-binding NarL/FixJ family response regulator
VRSDELDRGALTRSIGADGAAHRRVLVFSAHALLAQGVVQLLPEAWHDHATVAPGIDALGNAPVSAVIVDLSTPHATAVAAATRAGGATVILLVPGAEQPLEPELLELADAVLLRDEVEARTLRLALAAGPLGMRLLPRRVPLAWRMPDTAPAATEPLGDRAQRALALLADGLRDAEIAHHLSLSESAVRKLIQRAVRSSGARTRCQAIAAAIRSGELR